MIVRRPLEGEASEIIFADREGILKTSADDYRWLVSDAARPWLEATAEAGAITPAIVQRLRSRLDPSRAHLVVQQAELRRRGRTKFERADRMFFLPAQLEQATDEAIARYKSDRFASGAPVADLCCGIGGDAVALAADRPLLAVDRDVKCVVLADANLRAASARDAGVRQADVAEIDLREFAAWHIDPDRRAGGRRATAIELLQPSGATIEAMWQVNANGAVKLAPATVVPPGWQRRAQLEWIGSRGECRQQVAWFGSLANEPGTRSATVVDADGGWPRTFTAPAAEGYDVSIAAQVGRFVFEPQPPVLAARLENAAAAAHRLQALSPEAGYFTSDQPIDDPLWSVFEVVDVLPLDGRRLQGELQRRGIGRLEVKKRGVDVDPNRLAKRFRKCGERAGVLLLARQADRATAILAQRHQQRHQTTRLTGSRLGG